MGVVLVAAGCARTDLLLVDPSGNADTSALDAGSDEAGGSARPSEGGAESEAAQGGLVLCEAGAGLPPVLGPDAGTSCSSAAADASLACSRAVSAYCGTGTGVSPTQAPGCQALDWTGALAKACANNTGYVGAAGGCNALIVFGGDTSTEDLYDPNTGALVAVVEYGVGGSGVCLAGPADITPPPKPQGFFPQPWCCAGR